MSTIEMVSEETATPAPMPKPKRKYTRRTPLTSVKKAPVEKATPARRNTSHAGHDHPSTKVAREACRRAAMTPPVESDVSYKLQAEQLRGALADTQGALNEMRRSFEEANQRAERAEKHTAALLDFLAVAMTFPATIVPPKGL